MFSKFIFLFYNASYRDGVNKALQPFLTIVGLSLIQLMLVFIGATLIYDSPTNSGIDSGTRKMYAYLFMTALWVLNYLLFETTGYFKKTYEKHKSSSLNTPLRCRLTVIISIFSLTILALLLSYLRSVDVF